MFASVSPGPLGIFAGPQTWYMKNTHSPSASSPSTLTGLAIAIVASLVLS